MFFFRAGGSRIFGEVEGAKGIEYYRKNPHISFYFQKAKESLRQFNDKRIKKDG